MKLTPQLNDPRGLHYTLTVSDISDTAQKMSMQHCSPNLQVVGMIIRHYQYERPNQPK